MQAALEKTLNEDVLPKRFAQLERMVTRSGGCVLCLYLAAFAWKGDDGSQKRMSSYRPLYKQACCLTPAAALFSPL